MGDIGDYSKYHPKRVYVAIKQEGKQEGGNVERKRRIRAWAERYFKGKP